MNYSASKAGVEGLTRTAAKELSKCVSMSLLCHTVTITFTHLQFLNALYPCFALGSAYVLVMGWLSFLIEKSLKKEYISLYVLYFYNFI